ncbi:hypothetical protein EON65_04340 [archaeon]|nr:MAG: hypothetical protein EON65_04340 [archaeon]
MGNFLETCNLDSHKVDADKNRQSKEAAAEAHFYLSDLEKEHLWAHFNEMFTSSKRESSKNPTGAAALACVPQKEAFVKVLTKNYHPHLAEVIFDYLLAKHVHSYPAFESFVIDCARISSSRSLEMVFEIAHYGSNSHPLLADRTLLGKLCYLLYLFALGTSTSSNEMLLAESSKLEDFYINAHLKMHGKENANVEFSELVSITLSYFPHAIKAFQTYFCLQLLHSDESPSYKPFRPLELIDKSDIASSEQLACFSMHSDDLQGGWKRLYSSATDGLSFNRVVHHILGYEVSNPPPPDTSSNSLIIGLLLGTYLLSDSLQQ